MSNKFLMLLELSISTLYLPDTKPKPYEYLMNLMMNLLIIHCHQKCSCGLLDFRNSKEDCCNKFTMVFNILEYLLNWRHQYFSGNFIPFTKNKNLKQPFSWVNKKCVSFTIKSFLMHKIRNIKFTILENCY